MKLKLHVLFLALVATGCTVVRQTATTTSTDTNGLQTVTVARSTIFAAGDARQAVDRVRASAGRTSSVGASGVQEETTTTNANAAAGEILGTALRALAKP